MAAAAVRLDHPMMRMGLPTEAEVGSAEMVMGVPALVQRQQAAGCLALCQQVSVAVMVLCWAACWWAACWWAAAWVEVRAGPAPALPAGTPMARAGLLLGVAAVAALLLQQQAPVRLRQVAGGAVGRLWLERLAQLAVRA